MTLAIFVNTIGLWLRAHRKTYVLQRAAMLAFSVTVTAGLFLETVAGVEGAFAGYALAQLAALIFVCVALKADW